MPSGAETSTNAKSPDVTLGTVMVPAATVLSEAISCPSLKMLKTALGRGVPESSSFNNWILTLESFSKIRETSLCPSQ